MEIKKVTEKIMQFAEKYKYAIFVLLIGLALLLFTDKQSLPQQVEPSIPIVAAEKTLTQDSLAEILQSISGAGKVKVLLSMAAGEETIYQTDDEALTTDESNNQKEITVIITDSQRSEAGLVRQVNPVTYKGAIVVCQGADNPAVRLAVTQAVSKITGLGTDAICVLKMQ